MAATDDDRREVALGRVLRERRRCQADELLAYDDGSFRVDPELLIEVVDGGVYAFELRIDDAERLTPRGALAGSYTASDHEERNAGA